MSDTAARYERIASNLKRAIRKSQLLPGERLPSVRDLARLHQVSPPTAERALRELEAAGLAVARPRSGFFVADARLPLAERRTSVGSHPRLAPRPVTLTGEVHELFSRARSPDLLMLGAATPCPDWLPVSKLSRSIALAQRRLGAQGALYSVPPGRMDLRRQIARRATQWGGALDAERVIITAGATQAMQIALQVTTRAGDTVAIESPCYFGTLMLLKSRGLKAIEIPTSATEGMDLGHLATALDRHRVAAVIASPTANNPMGFTMSTRDKQRLVDLCTRRAVPLIEDDLYGDLVTTRWREPPCKAFDTKGLVLYCSSVSKTLAPGWRVGWLEPGRFFGKAVEARVEASLAGSHVTEAALADLLVNGEYDRHVRRFAERSAASMRAISARIARSWPESTRLCAPTSGFLLWVELSRGVDSKALLSRSVDEGFSICPGTMFSMDGQRYAHCLRLNAGLPATPHLLGLIDGLGRHVLKLSTGHA
jgi:DNA-binding transcriptional MocR family regulator